MATKNYTDIEAWSIEDLIEALSDNPSKKKKIIIPSFQRNLVWKTKQKKLLINSIKDGLPIGALLVYKSGECNGNTQYQLIDGLQRTTAIKDYVQSPTKYYDKEDIDENVNSMINKLCYSLGFSDEPEKKNQLTDAVIEWVKSISSFSQEAGFTASNLLGFLIDKLNLSIDVPELLKLSNTVIPPFISQIDKASNINDTKIPMIIYSGDKENLPNIFQRLNSKGTQLSKYQIYAATWSTYQGFTISNTEIIEKIREKYLLLTQEGYEINNFDPDKTGLTDKYNYFEYFFGLGKYISEKYPLLFSASQDSSQTESIGFNISTVCLAQDLKDVDSLPKVLLERNIDVNILEKKILRAIDISNEVLKPYIGIKANKKNGSEISCKHSEFQIVSIIGKVFLTLFDPISLEEKYISGEQLVNLKSNIPYHYLFDILRGYWSGTGDSKAMELTKTDRYETPIYQKEWNNLLGVFFAGELSKQEKDRVSIDPITILFFKYIYTHKFSIHDELSQKEFEVEHLIPVNRLKKFANDNNIGIPIGAISNLCLLDKQLNRDKKDLTFYEYYDLLIKNDEITLDQADIQLHDIEDMTITSREQLSFISSLTNLESKVLYIDFLNKRFDRLKQEFYLLNKVLDV